MSTLLVPDSRIYGRWVQQSREEMGRQLARESGVPADLIVPVPDSGVTAALGYAAESGIPFNFGLIPQPLRRPYVHRAYPAGARLRSSDETEPKPLAPRGKRVILIDDSIIRGTTSRKIVRMVRAAGATEVHLRISCPPTIAPCFLRGRHPIDRASDRAQKDLEQIREYIEADSLAYLSLVGLTHSCTKGEPASGMAPGFVLHRLLHGLFTPHRSSM